MPEKNWATVRLPLYVVQYDQNGKGTRASFTPNLNRLLKFLDEGLNRIGGNVAQLTYRSPKPGAPPFVIAEMSGNHNQSLERALAIEFGQQMAESTNFALDDIQEASRITATLFNNYDMPIEQIEELMQINQYQLELKIFKMFHHIQ